ncbi:MAG TPA: hypothetical protein PLR87_15395 [Thermoanaerobaculaceae bacterium]|nr:hypothetical protein [Thermoanaerobaculaceae bacterium]
MPTAFSGRLSGYVTAGGSTGILSGVVVNALWPERTLAGTVAFGRWHAYEGACIHAGVLVKLDGAWVDPAELAGPVEIQETLDSPVVRASFGLIGPAWSALATEKVWTLTPVEIWWNTGAPGDVVLEQRFDGYVRTCQQAEGGPAVKVECQDAITAKYGGYDLCHEVEPFAGLTRGEIVRELCLDAGLAAVDCPDGAVWQKGLFTDSKKLFEFLREFIAPEGWKMRVARDGSALELWRPELLAPPIPADDEWGLTRIEKIQIEPPRDVPSRWVIRGLGAVTVDELGQVTTTTVTKVYDIYAPKRAVSRQETNGSITDLGVTAYPSSLRLVTQIVDEKTERGGRPVRQVTYEWGWYNPRAAQYQANPAGGTYDPLQVYIDEDGEFVLWSEEKFCGVGRRTQEWVWNDDRENTASTVTVKRWFGRLTGSSNPTYYPLPSNYSAYVWGDGESYNAAAEEYGDADEVVVTREFDAATGAVFRETEETWGYYARGMAVDGTVNANIRYSGRAQLTSPANWNLYRRKILTNLIAADGTLEGQIEQVRGYKVHPSPAGAYDWGDFQSSDWVEQWRTIFYKLTQFNVISEDQYEEVTWSSEGGRQARVLTGRVPSPGYRASAWTELRQAPIEVASDDATLEAWFGFRRRILQNDYVQTLEEARDLLEREKARELSWKLTIDRAEAIAEVGQTILVRHPEHGLARRGMVTEVRARREPRTGEASATYRIEVPL